MDNVFDILKMSSQIEEEVKHEIKGCIIRPSVALIQVGDNPVSDLYVKEKEEACNRVGIYFRHYKFEDNVPELTIINKIKELNNDDYVNGIMIQLPLPEKYNEKRLLNTIINSKDVDGLTDINIGRLISGRKTIVPSVALAVVSILKDNMISLVGKEVVIVGKGKSAGRPLITALLNEGVTLTICHSTTLNLSEYTKRADILISACGEKNIITKGMVKEKAVIINVGYSCFNGKIYSDVDFDKLSSEALYITPKKESIIPLTVAKFLENILLCYNNKK